MADFETTYLTLVVLAVVIVALAWLLAGFALALTNDGGDITDKPIRDPHVVLPRQLGAA
jgi:hypothetical protein